MAPLVGVLLPLEPKTQPRLTILLRPVIAILYLVVLIAYGLIAIIAAFVGWVAILVTGTYPTAIRELAKGFLRYEASFLAYDSFLVRSLPNLHAVSGLPQSVDVIFVDEEFSRSSTLIHFVLLLPAFLVSLTLSIGLVVIDLVLWIFGTVTGKIPRFLHQVAAVVVRFIVRASAYELLLTSRQPFVGFFEPLQGLRQISTDVEGEVPTEHKVPTAAVISPLARQLVVLTFLFGLIGIAGGAALQSRFSQEHSRAVLADTVYAAYNKSLTSIGTFSVAVHTCHTVACLQNAAVASAFTLSETLQPLYRLSAPAPDQQNLNLLILALQKMRTNFNFITAAQTPAARARYFSEIYVTNLAAAHKAYSPLWADLTH